MWRQWLPATLDWTVLSNRTYQTRVGSTLSTVETRNSSGDEIANVNFLYDDIVHVIQNTIDSYINSATARLGG